MNLCSSNVLNEMTDKDRAHGKPEFAEQATTNFDRKTFRIVCRQNSKVKCTQMFSHGPPRSLTTDWLQPLPSTADYPSQEALLYVCRVPKRLEPGLFNIGGHWRQSGSDKGGGGRHLRLLTSFFPCNAHRVNVKILHLRGHMVSRCSRGTVSGTCRHI